MAVNTVNNLLTSRALGTDSSALTEPSATAAKPTASILPPDSRMTPEQITQLVEQWGQEVARAHWIQTASELLKGDILGRIWETIYLIRRVIEDQLLKRDTRRRETIGLLDTTEKALELLRQQSGKMRENEEVDWDSFFGKKPGAVGDPDTYVKIQLHTESTLFKTYFKTSEADFFQVLRLLASSSPEPASNFDWIGTLEQPIAATPTTVWVSAPSTPPKISKTKLQELQNFLEGQSKKLSAQNEEDTANDTINRDLLNTSYSEGLTVIKNRSQAQAIFAKIN